MLPKRTNQIEAMSSSTIDERPNFGEAARSIGFTFIKDGLESIKSPSVGRKEDPISLALHRHHGCGEPYSMMATLSLPRRHHQAFGGEPYSMTATLSLPRRHHQDTGAFG
jgi:hypothetical protein